MTKYDDRRGNTFLVLWTLAVMATAGSFLFYLAVRVESIEHGYDLGRAYSELGRLREIERVLALEEAAHSNPERVDTIGRSLFLMEEPAAGRVLSAGEDPRVGGDLDEIDAVAKGGRK